MDRLISTSLNVFNEYVKFNACVCFLEFDCNFGCGFGKAVELSFFRCGVVDGIEWNWSFVAIKV